MIVATSTGGSDFRLIEAGTYPARCVKMAHIGTITEDFKGQKKTLNKVWIGWELPTELKEFKKGEGEIPYVLTKEFTLSLHEKATLRIFLKLWRGKDFTDEESRSFDISKLLGKTCMVSVTHKISKGKTYAEITNVSPLIKGFTVPDQINETLEFNYDNFRMDVFKTLPEFIRKKMESSIEFKKIENNEQMAELEQRSLDNQNDGLPF